MIVVVEPNADGFADAVFALVEQLYVDAEADPRSPRYFFGFAAPAIVESVRAQLVAMRGAAWDEGDERIRTASGQIVIAGHRAMLGWPLTRAVIVCSGDYPDDDTLHAVRRGGSVILVLDPNDPPTRADVLRRLDDAH